MMPFEDAYEQMLEAQAAIMADKSALSESQANSPRDFASDISQTPKGAIGFTPKGDLG